MKAFLRHTMESSLPGQFALSWWRDRRMRAHFARTGVVALERRIRDWLPTSVAAGPFRGMRPGNVASGSAWAPKILGTYERELHPWVQAIVADSPDLVVDLGCAEGYYAVGFAHVLPQCHIVAADIDPLARMRCHRLAITNGVADRCAVRGRMDHAELQAALERAHKPVLWCDVEGAEYDLLWPSEVPALRRTWVVFEDHGTLRGASVEEVLSRFQDTHVAMVIPAVARQAADLPPDVPAGRLEAEEWLRLIDEHRPWPQVWVSLRPKQ